MSWQLKGNTTKPGNHLWDEFVEVDAEGNETGRSSLNIITPQRITSFDICDHKYELDGNDAVCSICGIGTRFVLGVHKLKDGKVVMNEKMPKVAEMPKQRHEVNQPKEKTK